jgi:hypothetical protein
MKIISCLITIIALSASVLALEPNISTTPVQGNVDYVYVGDYNTAQGRMYVKISGDSRFFIMDLGTDLATTAYTTFSSASLHGRHVQIYYNTVPDNGLYQIYRAVLLNF